MSEKSTPEHSFAGWLERARRAAGFILALILAFSLSGIAVADTDLEINIPIDTVLRDIEAGTVVLLTDPPVEVASDLVGRECTVVARSMNQTSVHPGNDLLVETGNSHVLVQDVEAEPLATVNATGTVVLGSEIAVSLVMGPDEVFSAGIDVLVDCAPGATTTTAAPTTTAEVSDTSVTTTDGSSPTTVEQTTTTQSPGTTQPPGNETTTTEEISGGEVTTTTSDQDDDLTTTSSIEDEVLGTEVLPSTGPVSENLGQIALVLVAVGTLLLAAARSPEH